MGVIKRQGIKNTIATYIGFIIGFVNLIVIQPQFLTKEELGLTRILYSFSLLVAMFIPLGIGNATIKFFPEFKDPAKRNHGYLGFMMLFPIVGAIVAFAIILIFKDVIIARYIKESKLFTEFFNYVFPLTFFIAILTVLTVYCIANFKSTIPTYLNDIGIRLLTIFVVSLYYIKWLTLDQFIVAFVAMYAFQALSLVVYVYWFDKPSLKIDWSFFREKNIFKMVNYGLILWFAGVASIGLKYFDSIMIGQYMPLAFVGVYTVVAFVPTIIEAPINAFEKIAASKIAFAWNEGNMDEIRDIYNKSSLYMFLIGGFLFVNVNVNIRDLLTFLPVGYGDAWQVVLILSTGALFNMATGLNAPILFNSEKYKYGALFLISLSLIIIVLQNLFIPMFGLNGAALATATASLIYNSMLYLFVKKHFKLQPFGRENLIALLLIICLTTIGFLMPNLDNKFLNIFYHGTVLSALYIFVIYKLNIAEELYSMIPFLKRKSV